MKKALAKKSPPLSVVAKKTARRSLRPPLKLEILPPARNKAVALFLAEYEDANRFHRGSRDVWYSGVLQVLQGHSGQEATIQGVIEVLRQGLRRNAFERLKSMLDISAESLCRTVGIPPRTLARRQRFKLEESEGILRVASAFQRAVIVLGGVEQARRWFLTPKYELGERSPLAFCDTGPGAEEIEHILGRIEHGVFA